MMDRARQWLREDPDRVYGTILPLSRPRGDEGVDGLRMALPGIARDFGVGLLDLLEGPRTGAVTPEASMTLLDVPLAGMARAAVTGARVPASQIGIFAGIGAKTANRGALEVAERMAKEGVDPRAIWRDTGWFQGPDSKWRWEIDDSGAQVVDPFESSAMTERHIRASVDAKDNPIPQAIQLDDVLRHPEFEGAYPGVPEQGVMFDNMGGTRGRYDTQNDLMTLNSGRGIFDPDGQRSTALHELQHGVQQREGFAAGGSPNSVARYRMETLNKLREIQDRIARIYMGGTDPQGATLDELFQMAEPLKQAAELAKHDASPHDTYRRLAGEAEARAVQARRDMTPEQRRATFPLDSYDVPLNELIVRGVDVDPEFRRLWLQGGAT